ncbi:uncharacterized protein LOC135110641 isoform X1 [Scylla paramamosain]|uniref:uncharacterized protein LOC135110641 isoform X1 n=1 Tax=Scylla paramamosain TaxID=85552 RepID=UPI0030839BA5
MGCVFVAAFLIILAQVHCQVEYADHPPYYQPPVVPVTQTVTVTVTQTIRVPVTSDVWVSTATPYTVRVTSLATDYTYVADDAETVTAIVAVTNTPISVVRETSCINPVRTAVSVFTSFLTETERKDLYHTVTHIDVHNEVRVLVSMFITRSTPWLYRPSRPSYSGLPPPPFGSPRSQSRPPPMATTIGEETFSAAYVQPREDTLSAAWHGGMAWH